MSKKDLEAMKKRYEEQYHLYSNMSQLTNSENSKKYFTIELERLQTRIDEVNSWIYHELYIKDIPYARKQLYTKHQLD